MRIIGAVGCRPPAMCDNDVDCAVQNSMNNGVIRNSLPRSGKFTEADCGGGVVEVVDSSPDGTRFQQRFGGNRGPVSGSVQHRTGADRDTN